MPRTLNEALASTHISSLKKSNPKAYEGFLEFLVEDCRWEFTMEGKQLEAWDPDTGTVMVFDPGSTGMDAGQGWRDAGYTSSRAGRSGGQ